MATYASIRKPDHMKRRRRKRTRKVCSSDDFEEVTDSPTWSWQDRYDVHRLLSEETRHSHNDIKKNGGC